MERRLYTTVDPSKPIERAQGNDFRIFLSELASSFSHGNVLCWIASLGPILGANVPNLDPNHVRSSMNHLAIARGDLFGSIGHRLILNPPVSDAEVVFVTAGGHTKW
jgi:hypothetical protein